MKAPDTSPSVPDSNNEKLTPKLISEIESLVGRIGRPVSLMEVCGTHTMAIYRSGLKSLIPGSLKLLSGPGCPVCVTPMGYIDAAIELLRRKDVTVATYGDMIRVPGSETSLEQEQARGAHVMVVYSPLDALNLAAKQPNRKVVFLGIGFETTTPAAALTIIEAKRRKIGNFYMFSMHKLVPPALRALLAQKVKVDGFILPGHVSAILGSQPYEFIAKEARIAAVITGFEPLEIVQGILMLLRQIESGDVRVEIQYSSVVKPEGNPLARAAIENCFEACDAEWRGLGMLPGSGLRIREQFAAHDAEREFDMQVKTGREPVGCRCGEVLQGLIEPEDCALFGKRCTPQRPVGACMVSSEGTCAAHFHFQH